MSMKATAMAHPVQGLINHGFMDDRLVLPFHDSISVCTAPLKTVVTCAFQEEKEIVLQGEYPDVQTASRIDSVVSEIKKMAGIEEEYKIVSESDFPQNTGLGASSTFAALTTAAAEAAGLDLSCREVSKIAKRGWGSASESVTGWFSKWRTAIQEEFCYSSIIEDDVDMGMVVVLTESVQYTDVMPKGLLSLVECRLKVVPTLLYDMERAIKDHDIAKIGRLAERDSVLLHALSMTGEREMIAWNARTLRVMAEVKALREEGVEASFNVDTGGVYVNSYPEDVFVIIERIRNLGVKAFQLHVGGKAQVVESHLF